MAAVVMWLPRRPHTLLVLLPVVVVVWVVVGVRGCRRRQGHAWRRGVRRLGAAPPPLLPLPHLLPVPLLLPLLLWVAGAGTGV